MPGVRRVHFLLMIALAASAPSARAEETSEISALSLDQFTAMVLRNSLRSRTAEDNFRSAEWSKDASLRELSWPRLSAELAATRSGSDNDLGTETDGDSRSGALSVRQPFLTGGTLSLTSAWSRSDVETDTLGALSTSRTRTLPALSASLSQPIYLFLRNASLRNRRAALLSWENDRDSYRSTRLSIEFDARAAYYNLVLLKEQALVERQKLQSSNMVNDTTRALVKAGKLAGVELIRADIRSKRDQRRIQNVESSFEKAMNSATDLILMPPGSRIETTTPLSYEPFEASLEELTRTALENNPAIRSARRGVELSRLSLQRTREGNRPQFDARGTYALTRDRSSAVPLDPASWTLGLGMTYAFFDADQTRLATRRAEVSLANAKRSLESQVRDLSVAIENTYLELKRVEEQIADFATQRKSAEQNLRAIRLQYENGLTRLTDVFDAENDLRELALEYLGLLVNFNQSRDRIKVLVGGELPRPEGAP